jgi:hypothetical protein
MKPRAWTPSTCGLGTVTGPVDSTVGVSALFGRGTTGRGNYDGDAFIYSSTSASTYEVLVFLTATVDVSDQKTKARETLKEELEQLEKKIKLLEAEKAAGAATPPVPPVPPVPPTPPTAPEPPSSPPTAPQTPQPGPTLSGSMPGSASERSGGRS